MKNLTMIEKMEISWKKFPKIEERRKLRTEWNKEENNNICWYAFLLSQKSPAELLLQPGNVKA